MRRRVAILAAAALAAPLFAQQPPPPTEAQQRPIFRGGTHFVRVDAYPVKDGKIVENLRPADFEVFEDGKPQAIESFDFVKFETFNPVIERRDPRSQQEGFDLAADPRYRVFVIVVNIQSSGIWYMQKPLVNFLNRVLGRNDLFALLSTRQTARDLVLGQSTTTAEAEIGDFWRSSLMDRTPAEDALDGCGEAGQAVKGLYALDQTYVALESLVQQLGSLRQERKNIIFVSNGLQSPRPARAIRENMPPTLPKVGITNGRIGIGEHADGRSSDTYCTAEIQRLTSIDFWDRFTAMLRDAKRANVAFYTITPGGLQAPMADAARSPRPPDVRAELDRINRNNDSLVTLSNETDGVAIVNTNDLEGGMRRIAADLSAYYVLGYYTTNTKWDGGVRTIKVRLKGNGKEIRARRQYRAPTQDEINALASGAAPAGAATVGAAAASKVDLETPIQAALAVLERASAARNVAAYPAVAGKTLTIIAELPPASVEAGKWKDGADVDVIASTSSGDSVGTARAKLAAGSRSVIIPLPLASGAWPDRVSLKLRSEGRPGADEWVKVGAAGGTLVGDAIAYRSAPRMADSPVAAFEFTRNERIRLEWPLLQAVENRQVRLLDRLGHPFPIDVPLAEDASRGAPRLIAQLPLAALRGDYLIELTASAGGVTDRRLVAVRVR